MSRPNRAASGLPAVQVGVALLWVFAAMIPGSVLQLPDALFDVAFPAAFTASFAGGVVALARARDRRRSLIAGTVVSGALMLVAGALTIWWYFFFDLSGF